MHIIPLPYLCIREGLNLLPKEIKRVKFLAKRKRSNSKREIIRILLRKVILTFISNKNVIYE